MLVSIVAVIVNVLAGHGGFTQALISLANASDPTVPNGTVAGVFASMFGPDPLNLLGVVVLTSLGTWGLPQMVQKFYAIESESGHHERRHHLDHLRGRRRGRLRTSSAASDACSPTSST